MKLSKALKRVTKELKNDLEYRNTWSSNIAMAYKESELNYKKTTGKKPVSIIDKHVVANNAAEHFIKLLCDEYPTPEGR